MMLRKRRVKKLNHGYWVLVNIQLQNYSSNMESMIEIYNKLKVLNLCVVIDVKEKTNNFDVKE